MPLINAHEVIKYIRASAGRAGLNVVFETINQPRHDGKTIYLPQITSESKEKDILQRIASIDHEVAHDLHTSFEVLFASDIKPQSLAMFVWNILEDSRVNTIEANEYAGFRMYWDQAESELLSEIIKKDDKSFVFQLTLSLIAWESKINSELFPKSAAAVSGIKTRKDLDNVLDPFIDDLKRCHSILDKKKGTKATLKLAEDILKALGKEFEEELKKLPTPSESKERSEKETKEENKKEGEKEETSKEYKILEIEVTKKQLEELSTTTPRTSKEPGNVGINHKFIDTKEYYTWKVFDPKDFIVIDFPKGKSNELFSIFSESRPHFQSEYVTRLEEAGGMITEENFAQQVRKLIQIRAKVQTQYGVKKGKLDQSRLSRVSLHNVGEYSSRIFKNKIENKTLDAAISVLVDMSGSMAGDKVYYALCSTILVNEVCTTLNIPLEITGFTDQYGHGDYPIQFIYKGFSDNKVSTENLKTYFEKASPYMAGNPDGDSILWSYNRLLPRKERKKIFIVMSDGSPAASASSGGLHQYTLDVIKGIEEAKKASIMGFGVCSNSVASFYKNYSIVHSPKEIPSKLLALIERNIINV